MPSTQFTAKLASSYFLNILLNILEKIAGEVFRPKGRHAYWKCRSCVTNPVLCFSSIRRGIDQNAELISRVIIEHIFFKCVHIYLEAH